MRILRSVRHKACADGSLMKEFLLDCPITPDFLKMLRRFGTIEMIPGIGEGFFKFEKNDCFSIKGFLNEASIEVRFKKEVIDITGDYLYSLFYFYHDGNPDYVTLIRRDETVKEKVSRYLYGRENP